MMSGRLQSGVNTLQGFREDKRNRVSLGTTAPPSARQPELLPARPHPPRQLSAMSLSLSTVSYINYGPFTSYAPAYDSSFASIGKDDSDLIMASYGEDSSQQGADRCEQTEHRRASGGSRKNS